MHQTSTGTKKKKCQQLLRSGPIVPGNFSFFVFFGACAGLVHLVVCFFVFFGACSGLVTLTSQNIDRHQKKQKCQQLLRSGPIVPGNFSFFVFFGACAGLVHLVVCFFCFFWCLCRFCVSIGLFVFLFNACAGFGDSRLCMFGSWPYFKLMFQRSKHTVIFE